MSGVKHTPWEVGQHPAVSNGWIVRPILFGSNVRVLPESEGGHVIIRDERIARLIAAAPDLLEALESLVEHTDGISLPVTAHMMRNRARDAIARARGEQGGGGE